MSARNRGAGRWIFIALGIVFVALGVFFVAANFSVMARGFPFAWHGAQAGPEAAQPPAEPQAKPFAPPDGHVFWYCRPWGPWRPVHGFGGGLIILGIVLLLIFFRRRSWRRHFAACYPPGEKLDAEEILKRAYAEGFIDEEEYRNRLKVLRE
jgi:hypothetical protein